MGVDPEEGMFGEGKELLVISERQHLCLLFISGLIEYGGVGLSLLME